MPALRTALIIVVSVVLAATCLLAADAFSAPVFFVVGMGFVALAFAARNELLGDRVMAILVGVFFLAEIAFGVLNAT